MFDCPSLEYEMCRSIAVPYRFTGPGYEARWEFRPAAFSHRLLSLSVEQKLAVSEYHYLARQTRYSRFATTVSLLPRCSCRIDLTFSAAAVARRKLDRKHLSWAAFFALQAKIRLWRLSGVSWANLA